MDEVIDQHLEWVKSIEYRYVEREPEELDGCLEEAGTVTGSVVGMTIGTALGGPVGGVLASGALAGVLYKIGQELDKRLRL